MSVAKMFGISVAAAAMIASASVAHADDHVAKVNVPFSFTAGDTQMPAGSYVITQADEDGSLVSIRSTDGKQSAFLLVTPTGTDDRSAQSTAVFDKADNQYVLRQVTLESADGDRVVLSPAAKRTAEPVIATTSH